MSQAAQLPISSVTVAITDTFGGLPMPYLTNEWGQYTFQIEYTGTYTITVPSAGRINRSPSLYGGSGKGIT